MFTGIVEGTGKVLEISLSGRSRPERQARLVIKAPFSLRKEKVGGSIAVNGCCLTMTTKNGNTFSADLSPETLRVTNLGKVGRGNLVNLERPLRLHDRLGGHLVQGHVDGLGKVVSVIKSGENVTIKISYPPSLRFLMIPKGSVGVNGVSMTVNALTRRHFSLVVIPHTLEKTNLAHLKKGQLVNLEADMIGKYVVASSKAAKEV